ncbi:ATP-dependent DNA helicase PIF1 [Fusarium oxysporum f. sp. raphani]|uniref:ATP-dependent DNA helicase n=1 Tax=Fusarium oxysporum f. sp. raphani TaxID=96318 RepID=A0A8J5NYN3_FUSOX|nr:ATP-dependent DNA helicase PIF1 [Fusarium oxysporum f. sp. raphani]
MERRDFELPDPDWMRDLSHCPLSDRDKELLEKFWTELENDRMEHCARCQETWFDMGLKGGICKRCIARDKNKKEDEPWFFSAENQLDFGLIPAFLPQLTIVEEMLIARVHVFVNVMQPTSPSTPELDVILLRPPTASEHAHLNRQFRRQFRVRRRCLQEWLNFLSNNHPGYRGITVCQKRMSVLPEDGDVLDQVATAAVTDPLSANLGNIENDDVEPDEVDQSAVPDLLPEDTEMEALRSHVLGEERGEHLPVRPSTQHQLEMPDIRRTPINEFNHSQALLSLAFPTLFPRGQADFVEPRLRPIKYADYIQHALRWHDGRFARHPTFRFVVFNTLMRAQARAKSSYFVKEYQQRQGLITRDDLLEAFQNPESAEAQQLLNSINRQTAQLRGTRPYWYRKRRELESYAYNLDCPGAFITFSPADLHWRSLYQHLPQFQDWQELPEQQRMGMSSKLLRDNPHIAAWHFYRRFGLFRDIVLKQKFNVTDYWNRYEWQGRGSSHCHGLFWMDGAPSVDLENEHLRKEFARIWRFHVTAFNPEPARVRQQGEGNPLAVNPLQHPLTFQWLSQVLNRCQRHHCSETYCLRKKKGSEEISCRFFFPRDTRDTADVVRRQGQSYFSFEAARNDSLMNHYNRCLSLGWLANIDISPCTSLQAVINYAAKYCSKMEKRTDSYASMGRQILPYVSHQNPLLSFASRLMNKLLTERDFSGQEICHVLLNCELQEGTRVIRAVDCRPYEQQGRSLRLQGDHDDAEVVGIYEKYLSRPPLHEELTYLDFLANWNTSKRDGRKWTRWSRQAKPRVLYYFPRYKSNHQHHQYDDFCRVKLMLAHPHRDPNELRKINGVEYNSYASAAEFCYGNHRHPDDYYGTPNAEERRPDPDEFEEEFHEPDLLEEDWLELARQLPDCPPSQEAIDLLGRRDIDIQYDWTPHVGRYADPGIVQGDYWRQRIEQNRLYMDVEDMPLEVRDALNPEQRIVYDTFIGHFQCGSEEQILLHVDGGGGTGKSYMIKVLSSHLQRLAGNRPSPIWRAAPTGVASNQIMGTTLHSLLRLPMDRAFTELSPADANAIQKKLRDVRYLVIDEKSMLGLRQLSWIDKRLRQVFPARAAEFFGGISIILVGDFFQLPPIANKPLYFDGPLKDLHEVSGQTAYRAFNHTVFLKKVQRQQGDDQAGFRLALEELRGLKLSIESWKLLSQRVQVKLSQREEDTFDAALRIYSKKARVNEYNYEHLVRLKHPAIQVMAKNIGNGADKATSEQAGNLAGQFPPAGLVNGAQGTVYDIGWAPGADAHRDPPSVIMMVMDKYTGPSYLTTDDGREVVPILPVKRDFFLGTSACTRKQFPLMASYAITVHKSQSITVDKMVTDLSERDFQTGLSYVAVSRVKMLDGLMIDAPFERASLHYEKLPDGKHTGVLMKVRDQDRRPRSCEIAEPGRTHTLQERTEYIQRYLPPLQSIFAEPGAEIHNPCTSVSRWEKFLSDRPPEPLSFRKTQASLSSKSVTITRQWDVDSIWLGAKSLSAIRPPNRFRLSFFPSHKSNIATNQIIQPHGLDLAHTRHTSIGSFSTGNVRFNVLMFFPNGSRSPTPASANSLSLDRFRDLYDDIIIPAAYETLPDHVKQEIPSSYDLIYAKSRAYQEKPGAGRWTADDESRTFRLAYSVPAEFLSQFWASVVQKANSHRMQTLRGKTIAYYQNPCLVFQAHDLKNVFAQPNLHESLVLFRDAILAGLDPEHLDLHSCWLDLGMRDHVSRQHQGQASSQNDQSSQHEPWTLLWKSACCRHLHRRLGGIVPEAPLDARYYRSSLLRDAGTYYTKARPTKSSNPGHPETSSPGIIRAKAYDFQVFCHSLPLMKEC